MVSSLDNYPIELVFYVHTTASEEGQIQPVYEVRRCDNRISHVAAHRLDSPRLASNQQR